MPVVGGPPRFDLAIGLDAPMARISHYQPRG